MLHLYLRLFGINDLLEIIEAHSITMKEKHFELAVSAITMNQRNRDAVKRVLVEGETVSDVARAIEMSQSQLSKQVRRVLASLYKFLDSRDLIVEEWIVDKEMKGVLDALEKKSLDAVAAKSTKRRKSRKTSPDEQ
jgi:transposase-like protein